MKVLFVGGSGFVGSLVQPYLAACHELLIFDPRPPPAPAVAYFEGDVLDFAAVREAAAGADALLYFAMGRDGVKGDPVHARSQFDVNVTGLHLALRAAHEASVSHAVVASTLSIYEGRGTERPLPDESVPPDAHDAYGLSKRLGEEVCRAACARFKMSVNVLRLCGPCDATTFAAAPLPLFATAAEDVAQAVDLALEKRFGGFEAFTINGDWTQEFLGTKKAKRMLGWEPKVRRD
jgi:nucleoside-diphosphate-sugar epimerase